MQEYAVVKIAGAIGGAVGTLAAIVARKQVSRLEAYSIVTIGVFLSITVPYYAASTIIDCYKLAGGLDTLFGLAGLLGLLSGLVGFALVRGIYKVSLLFENNPVPFLRKLLGIFGGEK